jgi:hypothetical protein
MRRAKEKAIKVHAELADEHTKQDDAGVLSGDRTNP